MLRPDISSLPSPFQYDFFCILVFFVHTLFTVYPWVLHLRFFISQMGCRRSRSFHVGVHPSAKDVPFLRGLKSTGAEFVSVETYTKAEDIVPFHEIQWDSTQKSIKNMKM
jgi:hypothetical protein